MDLLKQAFDSLERTVDTAVSEAASVVVKSASEFPKPAEQPARVAKQLHISSAGVHQWQHSSKICKQSCNEVLLLGSAGTPSSRLVHLDACLSTHRIGIPAFLLNLYLLRYSICLHMCSCSKPS